MATESTPANLAVASSEELAGDATPLAQALGEPEVLASLRALAELVDAPRPESLQGVRALLACYRERLLTPVELPAIRDAYAHAARGEARELIGLDRRLAAQFGDSAFANASRFSGRTQLRRLRCLRNSTLQRYIRAVEEGDATGWHVVVFGILLALFSLPLRQGLVHYATKTQHSLLDSASLGVPLSTSDRVRLHAECAAPVAPAVQGVLPAFDPRRPHAR
jgi:urease accessory protein UreF